MRAATAAGARLSGKRTFGGVDGGYGSSAEKLKVAIGSVAFFFLMPIRPNSPTRAEVTRRIESSWKAPMPERSIRDAYDRWATQYDTDANDIRDLNA